MSESIQQIQEAVREFDQLLGQVAKDPRFEPTTLPELNPDFVRYTLRRDVEIPGIENVSLEKNHETRSLQLTNKSWLVEIGDIYPYGQMVPATYEASNYTDQTVDVSHIEYLQDEQTLGPLETVDTWDPEPVLQMVRRTKNMLFPQPETTS
jgi:hypothetical protein